MKLFLILCLFGLTITASLAQDSQPAPYDDGWFLPTNAIATVTPAPTIVPLVSNPTYPGGTAAIAETITPDIAALARNLLNDPTRIFNYVHDHIRYVHYFGAHKGAEMTLLERSGNDFDQCALLVALLRSAGLSPNYQFGMVSISYAATNQQDYQHWVNATIPNTNWNTTLQLAANINGYFGYPYLTYFTGDTNDLVFHHVWVQVAVNGTNYNLDPAFKVSQPVSGIGLAGAMQLNTNTLMTAVSSGSTSTADYVQGLNEGNLRNTLGSYNSNLLSYIQSNCPNVTVQQVMSGESIVPSIGLPLGQPTPFTVQTLGGQWPISTWSYIPTSLMAVLIVNLPGTNDAFYLPSLNASRLSIVCTSNGVAQLWQEDSMLMSVPDTGSGSTFTPTLGIQHPFGTNWSFSTPGFYPARYAGFDQSVSTQPYQCTNATYVLLYGLDANPAWLTERQQKLDSYLAQGDANASPSVTSETLNIMGLGWLTQTELAQELLAGQTTTIDHFHHRLGRMALESGRGYYIDVYEQVLQCVANNSITASGVYEGNQGFQIGSYFGSAMEHGIIEQLQNSNLVAASTVKLLELASTNNEKIYLATSANWTAGANVSGNISNYVTGGLYTNFISQGYTLLLPQNGSIAIAGTNSWAGSGYVAYFGSANGAEISKMLIGGAYNGGYVSSSVAVPSTVYIDDTDVNQPTYFDLQSSLDSVLTPTGADPVNLVDGSFEITSADLSLGQIEPRGLNFTRYYSSARRNSNLAGMGPGWVHSYYYTSFPTTAPFAGLGSTTPQQMAPMIVAVQAAANIYNSSQPSAKTWVVTALIAKWGLDQLTKNAVSVNLGDTTIQFVKQPDGSYTPPANCKMSLLQTNSAYWLSVRHGNTFKFGTNGLLSSIVDQYGQSLSLTYNASNWVHTVTDWTNRTLTFTYTGSTLTSVSDGTRSASYGYTGGELTSFTDAEGKTSAYAYDTNNQIIATHDALGRLIVTNAFDAYGHITTQLTEGTTNKTWQVFASGYGTVEIDPDGGIQQYIYDDKARETSFQDPLGNLTQMVYDGQDHAVVTVSPLGETNEVLYDGNNNVVETIDPLGFTNQFVYDSQNNLIATIDPRGMVNTFGYNAQFSLIGQTNGAGDWVNYGYNANGTLASRSDFGGTRSYGYDSFGQLNLITYPASLGSEHFINSAYGDATNHTDARGFARSFQYNNRRQLTNSTGPTNLVVSIAYDAIGNAAVMTDARGHASTKTWSPTRHLLSTLLPAVTAGAALSTNVYDNADRLIKALDPLQNPTLLTNDLGGRLISTTDPVKRTTVFGYDADGRQLTSINAANETNSQTWDARGSLIRLTDGAGHFSLRGYDPSGNQILLTNRNTNTWQFQFDAANRITNTLTPLLRKSSVTFNHQGLPVLMTNPLGQNTTNSFDGLGRLLTRGDKVGTTSNSYDGNNNLTNVFENGNTNVWTYDAYNRVSSYRDIYGNLIQYRYDASGNMTNLIYPGNRIVAYGYDNLNHLTNVTDWSGRTTTLAYDLDGHLAAITRPNGTFRTISYDAAGQVTNIWEQMANGLPIAWFRLNWTNSGNMAWEFAAPLPHTNTPPLRQMTYDSDNRLASFKGPGMAAYQNVGVDLNGNLTNGPVLTTNFLAYVYDARNRLLNAGGTTNAYDAVGNRIGQTVGTTNAVYVINSNAKLPQVLMRIKNGVTNYYIYGAGLLYQVTEAATGTNTLTYHCDYRGSTVALSGDNGLVTERMEYSLYGSTTYRTGTNDTPFLFAGGYGVQTDPNGLLYMRARYYNPYLCRFINADPSGFAGGLNFYAYCEGNPVSNDDPLGLQIPSAANVAVGFGPGFGESTADWNAQFAAANQRASQIEMEVGAGALVGAGGATVLGAGAIGLVGLGVPASTVTGGLLVIGSAGIVTTGISIYSDPSIDNIAFNAGGIGGGFTVGNLTASSVAGALSPSGYQPSGPVSLASDLSMAWTDANGNINPLAFLSDWLLSGATVGPMTTGPSTIGAETTIGGFGSGVTAGSQLLFGSPTGK